MHQLFRFTMDPLELVARGTMMYVGLILVLRFILRRDVGAMSTPDLMFVVIIADASQNAMAGGYRSVTDGLVLVGTLVVWNLALDWLSFHFVAIRKLVEPPALPLIRDGKLIRRNLKKEWITVEEVNSKLREAGIEDIAKVHLAVLESDGELGIIQDDAGSVRRASGPPTH